MIQNNNYIMEEQKEVEQPQEIIIVPQVEVKEDTKECECGKRIYLGELCSCKQGEED